MTYNVFSRTLSPTHFTSLHIEYIGICLYMTAAVASKNHKTTKLHHESEWKMQEDANEARVKPRHKRNM